MHLSCLCFTLIWIASFIWETSAFGVSYWRYREKLERLKQQRAKEHVERYQHHGIPLELDLSSYPDLFHTQPLDHFDPLVKGTYQQRYWVNADHWTSPHGPVFLYIGGEGALTFLTVQSGEHVDLAKKYKALIFAVEHRYYGESINQDGLELHNLQFLSSQQALADLASFHHFASSKFNLTATNLWICFGGSYPGALSAWFRMKYPHLVFGAIASSAPVKAKVNFEGYNSVVAASLSDPIVNGSTKCALNVKEAFKMVDLMLAQGKYEQLSVDFLSCDQLTNNTHDLYQFASNLADVFMGTVQYNDETPGMSVTTLCEGMNKPGSAYNNLIMLNKKFLNASDQNCTDNSWASFIKQVSDTSTAAIVGVGLRQWLYQTCTQFGYYQTCDANTTCLFSQSLSLQPNLDLCLEVFNMSPDTVYKKVMFTNDYYGSNQPRGTKIVFVNGSIDPWHALSVLKDLSASETAIFIQGTAHCANMRSSQPSDSPALKQAKMQIDKQIGAWLEDAGYKVPGFHVPQYNSNGFQRL